MQRLHECFFAEGRDVVNAFSCKDKQVVKMLKMPLNFRAWGFAYELGIMGSLSEICL